MSVHFVFFDIGGTLGGYDPAGGRLIPYPDTPDLLARMRNVLKLRMGIITTFGTLSNNHGLRLLADAGLSEFFEEAAFVSEHDVNGQGKPSFVIYQFAAETVGARIEQCLFIGEDLVEVVGALAAGMQAILKPRPPAPPSKSPAPS